MQYLNKFEIIDFTVRQLDTIVKNDILEVCNE